MLSLIRRTFQLTIFHFPICIVELRRLSTKYVLYESILNTTISSMILRRKEDKR